ncbi:hypothetical protein P7C70_g5727, partial [Phenoliferia sp. Uapishka_3]
MATQNRAAALKVKDKRLRPELDDDGVTAKRFKGDGDVVLISSDDIRFVVHKLHLCAASPVFADMFAVGRANGEGTPEVQLEETGFILDSLLRFIIPKPQDEESTLLERLDCRPQMSDFFAREEPWLFLSAIDKYEIARAVDALRWELTFEIIYPLDLKKPNSLELIVSLATKNNNLLLPTYAFAIHFNFRRLAEDAGQRASETLAFNSVMTLSSKIEKHWMSIPQKELLSLLTFVGTRRAKVDSLDEYAMSELADELMMETHCTSGSGLCQPLGLWPQRRENLRQHKSDPEFVETDLRLKYVCDVCFSSLTETLDDVTAKIQKLPKFKLA